MPPGLGDLSLSVLNMKILIYDSEKGHLRDNTISGEGEESTRSEILGQEMASWEKILL